MANKKGNHIGSVRRFRLMNVCRHLGFADFAGLSNAKVVSMIMAARPQIKLPSGQHQKAHAIVVLEWFEAHEPAALKKPKGTTAPASPKGFPTVSTKDAFYRSWEWRTIRMEVLKQHGAICQCCGSRPGDKTTGGDPVRICVDHIKPLSKRWDLRLERTNLQVLCDECNQGKGAWDETDFRDDSDPKITDLITQQLRYVI